MAEARISIIKSINLRLATLLMRRPVRLLASNRAVLHTLTPRTFLDRARISTHSATINKSRKIRGNTARIGTRSSIRCEVCCALALAYTLCYAYGLVTHRAWP